jgi:hypothetical protein
MSLDNLSRLDNEKSDMLCRLATGAGFGTRQLYSDMDEVIIALSRPMILNGIPELATRSDLADRSIAIELPVIAESDRRTERELLGLFAELQPFLLGCLLDGVRSALRSHDKVKGPLSRLADLEAWMTAAEPGLGLKPDSFRTALRKNRDKLDKLAIDSSSVASSMQECFGPESSQWEDCDHWEGTATALLDHLRSHSPLERLCAHDWPKTPRAFSATIRRLVPNLRRSGISISFKPGCKQRLIRIEIQRSDSTQQKKPPKLRRLPLHRNKITRDMATPGKQK